jgi:hypothetical protein
MSQDATPDEELEQDLEPTDEIEEAVRGGVKAPTDGHPQGGMDGSSADEVEY